ncbi:solute carrier family 35, member B1 [Tribonema minus]|uniref:Solute carrier family 35, member B1 n=1 Tax=Tribonema minus TaxID=303371 RepID=A0A836CQP3_9STRA|nr:solute carrier family 35, member B1 [Tribonema minus]
MSSEKSPKEMNGDHSSTGGRRPEADVEEARSTLLGDSPSRGREATARDEKRIKDSFMAKACNLAFCSVGLLASYLTWGFVQEVIMTITYDGEKFPSSTFVVFSNRLLALLVAAALVYGPSLRPGNATRPKAPLVQFAPCSFSNVLSSWAQYECLKYISFPMQVVSKSCKVIPVMLVGKFVHHKSYPWIEYIEAVGITVGVSMFSLNESSAKDDEDARQTQFFGLLLVAMYLTCDSFTSQWQDRIFQTYKIDQYQMMLGINMFSIFFTTVALLWSGELFSSIAFVMDHPVALKHLATLSITSATGQLFIFYTIKNFGPIIFTIIMTCRQMFSLVISTLWFGHVLGLLSLLGTTVVFGTLGYRIKRKYDGRAR